MVSVVVVVVVVDAVRVCVTVVVQVCECWRRATVLCELGQRRPRKIASDNDISRHRCGVLGVVFN